MVLDDDIVTLQPSASEGITLTANGKIVQVSESQVSRWSNGQNRLSAYALPGQKNAVVNFPNQQMQLYFDGQRVVLFLSTSQRNKVRGICGTFDGEQVNDFTTPNNCVVKNSEQFVESYSIPLTNQGLKKEVTHQYMRQREDSNCFPKEITFGDVVSELEAGRVTKRNNDQSVENSIEGQEKRQRGCSNLQVQIVKEGAQTCFSLKKHMSCNAHCTAFNKFEKQIDFHCSPESNKLTQHWQALIKKGAHPDFSQRMANKRMTVMLPHSCIPN